MIIHWRNNMKYVLETITAQDACTDVAQFDGVFVAAVEGSMFRGTVAIQKSLDGGETWETAKDTQGVPVVTSCRQIAGFPLKLAYEIDAGSGAMYRGQITSHEFGSVLVSLSQNL